MKFKSTVQLQIENFESVGGFNGNFDFTSTVEGSSKLESGEVVTKDGTIGKNFNVGGKEIVEMIFFRSNNGTNSIDFFYGSVGLNQILNTPLNLIKSFYLRCTSYDEETMGLPVRIKFFTEAQNENNNFVLCASEIFLNDLGTLVAGSANAGVSNLIQIGKVEEAIGWALRYDGYSSKCEKFLLQVVVVKTAENI